MSELSRLRQELRQAFGSPFELPVVPGELSRQISLLERSLGGGGGGGPPRDRMREAVAAFWESGRCGTVAVARLVCFGAIERFWPARPALIEDAQAFLKLLRDLDDFASAPRALRRCYRGLVHCYFAYDPEAEDVPQSAVSNWRKLREYLDARLEAIRVLGFEPEWTVALREHRNLVTEEPVSRYAESALRGDMVAFSRVCQAVEIADTSWVVRRLVLAQVEWATEQVDDGFKSYVGPLLATLERYPIVKSVGLAALINRYAEAKDREEHSELREAAIAAWGNPLLELNRPKWSRVTDTARRMVAGWTTRILIRQFFEVLSHDRHTDRRRLQFWERYYESMDSVYYALGPTARCSMSPDIRKLREIMGSNQLGLSQGGKPTNNAFIMVIGRYVAVEFGLKGNASFIFKKDALPFGLIGEVYGDSSGLKHHLRKHRLLHTDTSHGTWESEFERVLGTLGIRPEQTSIAGTSRQLLGGHTRARPSPISQREPLARDMLLNFFRAHGITFSDKTRFGGALTVNYRERNGAIAEKLREWGFEYGPTKRVWYRREWPS